MMSHYDEIEDAICSQLADEQFFKELQAEQEAEYVAWMQEEREYWANARMWGWE